MIEINEQKGPEWILQDGRRVAKEFVGQHDRIQQKIALKVAKEADKTLDALSKLREKLNDGFNEYLKHLKEIGKNTEGQKFYTINSFDNKLKIKVEIKDDGYRMFRVYTSTGIDGEYEMLNFSINMSQVQELPQDKNIDLSVGAESNPLFNE